MEDDTIKLLRECNAGIKMGVKSLYKYLHKYKASDERVKGLVSDVIKEEEELADSLKKYL